MKFSHWSISVIVFFTVLQACTPKKKKEHLYSHSHNGGQTHTHIFPIPKHGNTYVIAHRGAHNKVPENTLAAYQNAIDLGCDFVEIDLRKTKDGRFVSIHNETIDSYFTGKSGKVSDFSLSELQQTPLGKNTKGEDEYIPTFEDILTLCKGKIGIYLDLKEADITNQVAIVKRFKMQHDIVWYIYPGDDKAIKDLQKECSQCFVMPDPGDEIPVDSLLETIQPKVIASDMDHLNDVFVATAHLKNAMVFVDDKKETDKEWQQIIDWKTDGIQTNQPEKLIEFLKKQQLK